MRVEVEGEEVLPEEVSKLLGWKTAGEKLKQKKHEKLSRTQDRQDGGGFADTGVQRGTQDSGAAGGATGGGRRHHMAGSLNKGRLLRAARMPDLPRDDIKIVMRPRGGLQVCEVSRVEISRAIAAAAQVGGVEAKDDVVCPNRLQNIVIVSTPKRENADKYALVERIVIDGNSHEVSAYESAPHGTVKGVIRGVPLTDTAQEIQELVVHEYNPSALQASRIGKTKSVVIAFAGPKVPNYVRYGNLLVECSLYRKQIDICYQCGRVGHRMDVCPNPQNRICRGCGVANPDSKHTCNPKCGLCGGNHLTADRTCKARFKTPYVVRRRRWERRRADAERSEEPRGHESRRRSTSRDPRGAGRTPSAGPSGRRRAPPSDDIVT